MWRSKLRVARRWLREHTGREPRIPVDLRLKTEFHGSGYGGWSIVSGTLDAQSVIYSFGVGEDASFDTSLINRYGCDIHAFDPTPRSAAWVQRSSLGGHFKFRAVALAAEDRTLRFYLPRDVSFVSASLSKSERSSSEYFDAPCFRLRSIMNDMGHRKLDVLKMDIEGAEYSVLEEMFSGPDVPQIDQLLVEFHHWMQPFTIDTTASTLSMLRKQGYCVAWRSDVGHEVLLCRRSFDLGAATRTLKEGAP